MILFLVFNAWANCTIDAKSAVCWALCRRDGYDSGYYAHKDKMCICSIEKPFDEISDKVIKIHKFPKMKDSDY